MSTQEPWLTFSLESVYCEGGWIVGTECNHLLSRGETSSFVMLQQVYSFFKTMSMREVIPIVCMIM